MLIACSSTRSSLEYQYDAAHCLTVTSCICDMAGICRLAWPGLAPVGGSKSDVHVSTRKNTPHQATSQGWGRPSRLTPPPPSCPAPPNNTKARNKATHPQRQKTNTPQKQPNNKHTKWSQVTPLLGPKINPEKNQLSSASRLRSSISAKVLPARSRQLCKVPRNFTSPCERRGCRFWLTQCRSPMKTPLKQNKEKGIAGLPTIVMGFTG